MNARPRWRFDRVRNRTLRDEVLEPLRNAILLGQIPSGERLLEGQIAAQMGVSRVPVREALQHLAHEGLVVSYPHRGTVVTAVDEDEVDVLYHLRAELEGAALRALMDRPADDLIDALRGLIDAMARSSNEENVETLAEQDVAFHRYVVERSGYRILAHVWGSMDGPIRARLYRSLNGPFRGEMIRYTPGSHQPIVDAIAARDVDRAVGAIKHHILEVRELIEKGVRPESVDT